MKIKNKYIVRLNGLVKFLWIIILLVACRNDDNYSVQQDGPVLVKLSVSTSDTGMASGNTAGVDMQISSIYILQFNADADSYGTLRYVAEGQKNTEGSYTADLLQSMGANDTYKLVILANLPDYGFLYGLYGKSYAEVQKACLSVATSGPLAFDQDHLFPMFGVANGGASVQVVKNTVYNEIKLVRAVARVDIGVGISQKGPDGTITSWTNTGSGKQPFTMAEVQVWRAGQQYTYMPAVGNFHWNTVTTTGEASKEIVIDLPSVVGGGATTTKTYSTSYITNGTYCLGQIYLPEADLKWGSVYDDQHTNRLAIIVGGYYNGSTEKSYYRVDFTNDDSGKKMNILRNHIYQFSITKVADKGYATPEEAYNSKPVNMNFTAELVPWTASDPVNVPSIIGYYISFGMFNSDNLVWDATVNPVLTIPKKRNTWYDNRYWTFDYNTFYYETSNHYYVDIPNGGANGKLYPTVENAFLYEGVYPSLMVSGDDVIDVQGNETIAWKTGNALTAFDICRDYNGSGYTDWRLPRLSELALIYLNQDALTGMRGFIRMKGTYWCGSEYLVSNSDEDRKRSNQAWAIDFDGTNPGNAIHGLKTVQHKIRCVRQIK